MHAALLGTRWLWFHQPAVLVAHHFVGEHPGAVPIAVGRGFAEELERKHFGIVELDVLLSIGEACDQQERKKSKARTEHGRDFSG